MFIGTIIAAGVALVSCYSRFLLCQSDSYLYILIFVEGNHALKHFHHTVQRLCQCRHPQYIGVCL